MVQPKKRLTAFLPGLAAARGATGLGLGRRQAPRRTFDVVLAVFAAAAAVVIVDGPVVAAV